jgi:hypothetical protein
MNMTFILLAFDIIDSCYYSINQTVLFNETARFKNVNNCWNNNISFYFDTSGGQNSNLCLNVVHFFNTSVK